MTFAATNLSFKIARIFSNTLIFTQEMIRKRQVPAPEKVNRRKSGPSESDSGKFETKLKCSSLEKSVQKSFSLCI